MSHSQSTPADTLIDAQGIHSSSLLDTQHTPWPAQRAALTVKARRSSRLPGKRQERESWIVVISGPNGPVTLSAPQGAAPRGRRTPPAALTRSLDQIWDWASATATSRAEACRPGPTRPQAWGRSWTMSASTASSGAALERSRLRHSSIALMRNRDCSTPVVRAT